MSCLTIKRGNDGFGSQLFSIISGICYCEHKGIKYLHSKIENIKLVDKASFQNDEITILNEVINQIIINMKRLMWQQADNIPYSTNTIGIFHFPPVVWILEMLNNFFCI